MISPKINTISKCDVLVVGGGLAGTWAAVAAKECGARDVFLVDKSHVARSGQSTFAAGVFTVFDPSEDDFSVWMKEMVEAGEYLNDQRWIELLFEMTYPLIKRMDGWGVDYGRKIFEKDSQGRLIRRLARGHINTKHNITNSLPMMETMKRKLNELGVRIVENVMITDLLVEGGQVIGALGLSYRERKVCLFISSATIISASGCGFKSISMGIKNLTGDLLAAAFDIGAVFQNMENSSSNTNNRDLGIHGLNWCVSMGGKFLNAKGEEFMWEYDPILGNRARLQDLVIAFCQEVEQGRGPIWLDMSAVSPEDQALYRKILPETSMMWDRAGINPFRRRLEWVPSFYGTLISGGGIRIDLKCQTNIVGLFAAGDITPIPPHGTYSIGGINLAFCVVSGYVAGKQAAALASDGNSLTLTRESRKLAKDIALHRLLPLTVKKGIRSDEATTLIQEAIIPYKYSYLRSRESIMESLGKLKDIQEKVSPHIMASSPHELVKANEAKSMVKVARMMMEGALFREESRGWHFRVDFPKTDNVDWLKWVFVQREGKGMKVWAEPVPTLYLAPKENYNLPPGVRRVKD